jgi:hypothetical protein
MVLGTHLQPCNPVETVSPPDSKLHLHYRESFIKVSSETVEQDPCEFSLQQILKKNS